MNPTVSVALKTYNHERYVEQSVRSVLEQSFDDFELVVTDDASTDHTAQIVAGFSDPRLRFERAETNRGIVTTMNATVARCRGEFIAILNGDDYALPGRLERQVAYLRAHPEIGAVFSAPAQVDDRGAPYAPHGGHHFEFPFKQPSPPRTEWLRYFFFHGNVLCGPSAMVRRSVWEQIGPDDGRLWQLADFDRWVRLLERHEIFVMPEALTAYRWRGDGLNASAPHATSVRRASFESLQVLRRYVSFEPDFLRKVFAADIAGHRIDTERPLGAWFAEVALHGTHPWHKLLALDALSGAACEPRDFERLRELSGSIKVFKGEL